MPLRGSLLACLLLAVLALPRALAAQEAWVQIEARPTEALARDRAAFWEARLGPLTGWRLGTGWHALALGPFTEDEAAAELARLRAAGSVPSDAFVADGRGFVSRFYQGTNDAAGAGSGDVAVEDAPDDAIGDLTVEDLAAALAGTDAAAPGTTYAPDGDAVTVDDPATADPGTTTQSDDTDDDTGALSDPRRPTQSLAEARRAERDLTRADRARLQRALAFAGVYDGRIDADFGPATRRAMSAWQRAQGFPDTGVLTARQRREALAAMDDAMADLALTRVDDSAAGVAIDMPGALIPTRRVAPPFVIFGDEGGMQVWLVSQPGGRARLAALYQVVQTLPELPADGPREMSRLSFRIEGTDDARFGAMQATTDGDTVKGFALVWPDGAGDAPTRDLVLRALEAGFAPTDGVLPDPADDMSAGMDLSAGLDAVPPLRTAAGVAVDDAGHVLTAAAAIEGCGRITLGAAGRAATVAATAPDLGVALLDAGRAVAAATAALSAASPAAGADVAVAGYPFDAALPRPALTWARMAGGGSLDVALRPGDAGGPVLTPDGAVAAVLTSPSDGGTAGAADLDGFLAGAGIAPARADGDSGLPPEELSRRAAAFTVPVTCWP